MTGRTGEKCQKSGIYSPSNGGTQIALSNGDTFPPSNKEAVTWTLVTATK